MSKLVSPEGKILVPGVNDLIAPVTEAERQKFEAINFGVSDIHAAVGGDQTLTDDKVTTLMGRMRNPSLSLHGIEGAFCELSARSNSDLAQLTTHSRTRKQDCHPLLGQGQILHPSRAQPRHQERYRPGGEIRQ